MAEAEGIFTTSAASWVTFLAVTDFSISRHRIDVENNLQTRKMRTRLRVLRQALVMIIFLVTVTTMLMTFPGARSIGVSLFASAGVAGIVVGFAARPVLSNLLAGIQIALTQPIRIQDAVVVEGEWGWIEEITPLEPYAQGARDSEAGAMVQQIDTPEEPPERTCSRREILWMRADNAASLRGTFIKLVKIGKI